MPFTSHNNFHNRYSRGKKSNRVKFIDILCLSNLIARLIRNIGNHINIWKNTVWQSVLLFQFVVFYPDLTPTSTVSVARVAIFQSHEVRRKKIPLWINKKLFHIVKIVNACWYQYSNNFRMFISFLIFVMLFLSNAFINLLTSCLR